MQPSASLLQRSCLTQPHHSPYNQETNSSAAQASTRSLTTNALLLSQETDPEPCLHLLLPAPQSLKSGIVLQSFSHFSRSLTTF